MTYSIDQSTAAEVNQEPHLQNLRHEVVVTLLIRAVLQNALHHTATEGMLTQTDKASTEGIQQVCDVLCRDTLDDLLYHMVAVLVTHAAHESTV